MSMHDLERKTTLGGPIKAAQHYLDRLDAALGEHYLVREPEHALKNLGIDRVLVNKRTRVSVTCEYRWDSMAALTGQVFIEMEVEEKLEEYRPGWLKNFAAQVVVFVDLVGGDLAGDDQPDPEKLTAIMVPALHLKALATKPFPEARIRSSRQRQKGFSIPWKQLEALSVGRLVV